MHQTWRNAFAEFLGTMLLLTAVVGSGIMGVKLAGGNDAIALIANSLATGGALVALIAALGPISGAHFNPAVSLFEAVRQRLAWSRVPAYLAAQILGAIAGVVLAHAMFGLPAIQASAHVRSSSGELIGEVVATFGLLLTIWGVSRTRPEAAPYAVASFIVGAYWFTSSTSFANPAVTLARSLTDTFAGIAPTSVPGFIACELIGLAVALGCARLLGAAAPKPSARSAEAEAQYEPR
jgi:glycerol uptake facilitator-like aquaporin